MQECDAFIAAHNKADPDPATDGDGASQAGKAGGQLATKKQVGFASPEKK